MCWKDLLSWSAALFFLLKCYGSFLFTVFSTKVKTNHTSLMSFSHLHHSFTAQGSHVCVFSFLRVLIFTLCKPVVDFLFFILTPVRKSNLINFYIPQIVTVPTLEYWVNGRGQRDANKQACRWITQCLCQQHACHRQRRHRPSQPWQLVRRKRRKGQQNDTEQTNGKKNSCIWNLPQP